MIVNSRTEKPILSRDVVNSLDILHRAILEVAADRGIVSIVDSKEASS